MSPGECAHGAYYGVDDYDPDHGPSYCPCGRCSECDDPRYRWAWHDSVAEVSGFEHDGTWTCETCAAGVDTTTPTPCINGHVVRPGELDDDMRCENCTVARYAR